MIIVNAKITPLEGKNEEIIQKAGKLIELSRTHEGNISYNLYQNTQVNELVFIERWQNLETLRAHMKTDEFIEFGQETKNLMEGEMELELSLSEILSNNEL